METSIPHFETIMTEFTAVRFPGAYYAAGKAYAFLRQHSDAVAMAKLGLEMVAVSSSCPPLHYPGTETLIEDSKRDVIEVVIHTHTHTHTYELTSRIMACQICMPCILISSHFHNERKRISKRGKGVRDRTLSPW